MAATSCALSLVVALLAPGAGEAADAPALTRLAGDDRIATAIAVSRHHHEAADTVVLVRADDFPDALAAAPLAAALGGPVLLNPRDHVPAEVLDELERLDTTHVVLLGGEGALASSVQEQLAGRYEVRRLAGGDRFTTAVAAAQDLGATDGAVVVSGTGYADALSAAPLAARLGWPLLLTHRERLTPSTRGQLERAQPSEVLVVGGPAAVDHPVLAELEQVAGTVTRVAGPDRYATSIAVHELVVRRTAADSSELWLATGRGFADALAAGPTVAVRDASLLLIDGADLREPLHVARHIASLPSGGTVTLVGGPAAITEHADWQLAVVRAGHELPRGGFTLFPRHRVVAFYGHHSAPAMGVLGEQPPDEAFARLWDQAHPYGAGGRPVLPTFELIVSVATSGPGPDGDYSAPSTPQQIQPWLDAARRHGVYLLLDLQPGRTDFLTEAKRYEWFLSQPDVGLALDPEWRMDQDEVPARSVGEVHATEVNQVADYLAGLVRTYDLPEKLLVVHQFQTRMVEDKHLVGHPPELAVLFHMDGHGSRRQKQDTYRHVSDPTGRWWNGFKLFYDEDVDLYRPHELLAEIRPLPDLISYQ